MDCSPCGFSVQGDWSGLPFPSPEDLPEPEIEPRSPALQADSLPSEPPDGKGGRVDVVLLLAKYLINFYLYFSSKISVSVTGIFKVSCYWFSNFAVFNLNLGGMKPSKIRSLLSYKWLDRECLNMCLRTFVDKSFRISFT